MFKEILILIGMLVLIMPENTWAQGKNSDMKYDLGKIIVTATKTESYQAEVGSSSTVITAKDIEKTGRRTTQEVLRDVPGVSVMQSGAFGGSVSVYLRGSKPGHTLVLIDGVEVNDPMSSDRSFNFAHLTTDNIERIEVVRGPQSTLYGSDALGGVINIITKKGRGKPKWEISSEGGSHNTFKENMGLSGSTEKLNYSISTSRLDSGGISKAVDGSEKDSYENTAISSKIGYRVFGNSELDLVLRFTDSETDLDDGSYEDDPNYTAWWRNMATRLSFNQALNFCWKHSLSFSYNDVRRKDRDEKDSIDITEDKQSWFKGDNKKIEWQHNFSPVDWDTITCGFEYEEERGSSYNRSGASVTKFNRKTVNDTGYYLQNQLKLWESLFVTPGLRVDDHELFGTESTYKISTAYFIPRIETRLKANWGTGFKAPSLYQLYHPTYGDINLKPDESKSYDFGFEQSFWNDKFSFDLTYFYNDFKNMVEWDSVTSKYKNINNAETKGFEIACSFKPIEILRVGTSYTYAKTKDKNTGKKLSKRPENQVGFNMDWAFLERVNLNLGTSYVGHQWDDSANTRKTKPYVTTDISISYNLTDNIQIFGRIENFFDRKYQEIRGYATAGRSLSAGGKVTF